ncbi:hypothetical protein HF086_009514 [Spodoptera exigua]|uniref:Uncharacterized protein n=1 Tax=Spodoptera exigua TaxID=7107 RepID=A0A922MEL1_SPOEX|nr:hypothetical protein HF086_009514 [Spodoptera exigua]
MLPYSFDPQELRGSSVRGNADDAQEETILQCFHWYYVDDETLGSLLDSETTIEELSRQILSEAKLWEAIQEASAEIARRKQKESY